LLEEGDVLTFYQFSIINTFFYKRFKSNLTTLKKIYLYKNILARNCRICGDGHGNNFSDHIFSKSNFLKGINIKMEVGNYKLLSYSCYSIVGMNHNFFKIILTRDGTVYSMGSNKRGQLGLGDNLGRSGPNLIPTLSNIRIIRSGVKHVVALDYFGKVYTWGSTILGMYNAPVIIEGLNNIIDVQCGGSFSVALDSHGRLFCWGENRQGQLGLGDNHNRGYPQLIKSLHGHRIIQIACGYSHVIALSNKGKVFAWGSNKHGELGKGDQLISSAPVQLNYLQKKNIITVDAGSGKSFVIDMNGKVLRCGIHTGSNLFVECGNLCLKCKHYYCNDDFPVHECVNGRIREQ